MTASDTKRRILASETRARKRRKADSGIPEQLATSRKVTAVNALPWSQAILPDTLDDAEGFFGLEEVSDVEIVRDEEHGRVEFRKPDNEDISHGENASEQEEWTGFDDPDSIRDGDIARADPRLNGKASHKDTAPKDQVLDALNGKTSFGVLDEVAEDEESD
ncbi:MAG: hypothetical protein Q9183_003727, partial [Haloplaca sp. 2 TL-2023]